MKKIIKKVDIRNIVPKKEERLVNTKWFRCEGKEPILVKKIGMEKYKILDGHHRYFKSLACKKRKINVRYYQDGR